MNIRFLNIELNNFLSFESLIFDLNNQGFISIRGRNENNVDSASSNGSGKSALFDGIFWILTGETIRGCKDVANIYLNQGVNGKLLIEVDDVAYYIIRSKDDPVYKTNLKIFKNDQNISGKGIRDSEKILANELPDLTSQLLSSVVLLGQGLPQRFSNNTPSGRKEILEQLSKSDFMIDDLKTRFNSRKTFISNKQREYEDSLIKLNTEKESLIKELDKLNQQLRSFIFLSQEEFLNKQLELINEIKNCDNDLGQLELKVSSKSQELDELNDNYSSWLNDTNEAFRELNKEYTDRINEVKVELKTLQAKINDISKLIDEYSSVQEYCPLCKQKLPDVHKIDTTDLESELNDYIGKKCDVQIRLNSLTFELSELNEKNQRTINQKTSFYKQDSNDLSKYITAANQRIVQLKQNKIDLDSKVKILETQYNQQTEIKNQLDKSIIDCTNDLASIESKILYINNELEKIKSRQLILSQISSILSRDFRGVLLTNVINYIQGQCQKYSVKLFNTKLIEFKLDGNKLNISYDGKEYETLSGGERQKIDIIVQFAIRDMLCKFMNFSSNILVLDEILDNLDEEGSQKVLDLITTSLNDVECVYIISHRQDFIIPFDKEVIIIKGADKISRLQ